MKTKITIGILILFVAIQFFRIDKTNPPINPNTDFIAIMKPPNAIASLIKDGCYDCHSNETEYPWYTNIAPLSWWIKKHINEGRKEVNFSEWGGMSTGDAIEMLEECYEKIQEGEMPLKSFTYTHPEARFTEAQKQALLNWFSAQSGSKHNDDKDD